MRRAATAPTDRLVPRPGAGRQALDEAFAMPAFRYAFDHLPAPASLAELLATLAATPGVDLQTLLRDIPMDRRPETLRALLFLAKRDLLTVTPGPA